VVIDSSALVAILFNEPEAVLFLSRMAAADICRLSAASFVELGIVLRRDLRDVVGRLSTKCCAPSPFGSSR
jgi:ribonuclease VapC